jgi:hypothetical protein
MLDPHLAPFDRFLTQKATFDQKDRASANLTGNEQINPAILAHAPCSSIRADHWPQMHQQGQRRLSLQPKTKRWLTTSRSGWLVRRREIYIQLFRSMSRWSLIEYWQKELDVSNAQRYWCKYAQTLVGQTIEAVAALARMARMVAAQQD